MVSFQSSPQDFRAQWWRTAAGGDKAPQAGLILSLPPGRGPLYRLGGIRHRPEDCVWQLRAVLQGGEEEVSDEAMGTMDLDRAFEKCVSRGQKIKN